MKQVFAEILTEDTAKLLERLSDYAGMVYDDSKMNPRTSPNSDTYLDDEEAAYTLAAKVRELLKGRDENCSGLL